METKIAHMADVLFTAKRADSQKQEYFAGNHERQLGKAVGVSQFGVNHVELEPGSMSSLRHWHEGEDEFVFVLSGELTLIDENGEHVLRQGAAVGFPAGVPNAHHLKNNSRAPASFLVVGTRKLGKETIHYPDDPLVTRVVERDSLGTRVVERPDK
jgi:uncharacterized cupin superfamily protein